MDRLSLKATERVLMGKGVKVLRREGLLPGNVYGNTKENEAVTISALDFKNIYKIAGETGLIDLKIGAEKVRPVMIRDVQMDPVKGTPFHVDFYQVNLSEKVEVPVPIVLIGEEPDLVKSGEAIVLQTISEVQVEALPTDLVEHIEVNIQALREIGDGLTVGDLSYDRSKLTVLTDAEEVVVKLDTAVSAEMEALLEEQQAEAEAAAAEAPVEGEPAAEGEEGGEESAQADGEEGSSNDNQPKEEVEKTEE